MKNMLCTLVHRPMDVPVWMEWLSKIDPWTYGVDRMRQVDLRESVPAQFLSRLSLHPITLDMAIIVGFSVLFIVPVVWLISTHWAFASVGVSPSVPVRRR
jgi:hypothetical protein